MRGGRVQRPSPFKSSGNRTPIRSRVRPPGLTGYGWLLWQDAGRSACGPVHWPLWPAPFPPFVGGAGSARAGPTVAASSTPANMLASAFRGEIFTSITSFPPRFSALRVRDADKTPERDNPIRALVPAQVKRSIRPCAPTQGQPRDVTKVTTTKAARAIKTYRRPRTTMPPTLCTVVASGAETGSPCVTLRALRSRPPYSSIRRSAWSAQRPHTSASTRSP